MKKIGRLFSFFMLLTLIIVSCLYLTLHSKLIIRPLETLFKEYTGLSISIGDIEYNPVYPGVILFSQVKISDFFYSDKIYAEFNYNKLINEKKLFIDEFNLINTTFDVSKIPQKIIKKEYINEIFIRDSILKNITIISNELKLENGIIEIHQADIFKNNTFQIPQNITFTIFSNRVNFFNKIFNCFNLSKSNQSKNKQEYIFELQTKYLEGSIYSKIKFDKEFKNITIDTFNINSIKEKLNIEAVWDYFSNNINNANINILDGTITNSSIKNKTNEFEINNVNLHVNDLKIDNKKLKQANITGNISSTTFQNEKINNIKFLFDKKEDKKIKTFLISGEYLDGLFDSYFSIFDNTLEIKNLTTNNLNVRGNDSLIFFKNLMSNSVFDSLNIESAVFKNLTYDSLDYNEHYLVNDANIYINGLYFNKEKIINNNKGKIEINGKLLSYNNIDLKNLKLNIQIDKDNFETLFLECLLNNGFTKGNIHYDFQDPKVKTQISSEQIDLNIVNLILEKPLAITGKGNIELKTNCNIQNFKNIDNCNDYIININLKDSYIKNFDINKIETKKNEKFNDTLNKALESNQNLIINSGTLEIIKKEENLKILGSINSINNNVNIDINIDYSNQDNNIVKITTIP